MTATELIDRYCQVWSEQDADRRAALLDSVWASDASYTDPSVHAVGAAALLAHIERVRQKRPGSTVIRTSALDSHHDMTRFAWRAIEASGNQLPEGLDIAFFSDDGLKIRRIIGFFGSIKPV